MRPEIIAQRDYWNGEAAAFQKIYTHEKSRLANLLDRVFRRDMYERFAFTLENCGPMRGRTYLDVGCGSGLYSLALARGGAARVVGLDIAENMVAMCGRLARDERLDDRCEFYYTDLLAFEARESFDMCIGIGLFDYIGDPLPVLRRMRELTTDRGVFSFPRRWTWRAPVRKARLSLRGCDVFFYTRREVSRLMEEAGFAGHRIARVGKLHCVVAHVGTG